MLWGIAVGIIQATTPLVFCWLDGATVYALGLILIASIYVGFAVADGRLKIIAIESSVAFSFVVIRRRNHRLSMAPSHRLPRSRPQRPLAEPHPLRSTTGRPELLRDPRLLLFQRLRKSSRAALVSSG
jgi:hypothetical protein